MPINLLESSLGVTAALIAAVTGIVNLFLLLKGKTDRFIVRYWSVFPRIEEGHQFSIISVSDHPIHIVDFGYILEDLTMCSVGIEQELGTLRGDDVSISGTRQLENHGQVFDVGVLIATKPLAVYGWSATQQRPKLAFNKNIGLFKRLWVRTRLFMNPYSLF